MLPLLRPALLAALVYSFVRAMTAISAVIFLVSANYDMATAYILGRVENGDYGLAIAYSSALILVMLIAIRPAATPGRPAPARASADARWSSAGGSGRMSTSAALRFEQVTKAFGEVVARQGGQLRDQTW